MAAVALQAEFEYYLAHQEELVKQYDGKVIVIKGCEVLGVFEDDLEAIAETAKAHEPGTFMVHRVSAQEEIQTIYSRAVFS